MAIVKPQERLPLFEQEVLLSVKQLSIKGLHTIGMEAVILTLGGTLGSVTAAWALWKSLYRQKGGEV